MLDNIKIFDVNEKQYVEMYPTRNLYSKIIHLLVTKAFPFVCRL